MSEQYIVEYEKETGASRPSQDKDYAPFVEASLFAEYWRNFSVWLAERLHKLEQSIEDAPEMWIARDEDGELSIHNKEPERISDYGEMGKEYQNRYWGKEGSLNYYTLNLENSICRCGQNEQCCHIRQFRDVTWENSPHKVKLLKQETI